MDPASVAAAAALAEQLARLGTVGLLALIIAFLVLGIFRIGKFVDTATAKADEDHKADMAAAEKRRLDEAETWQQRLKDERTLWQDREAKIIADRDAREAKIDSERDEWHDRSVATDARLDRVSNAFEKIAGRAAPE